MMAIVAALSADLVVSTSAQASTWQAWFAKPAAAFCPKSDLLVSPTSATTDSFGVVHLHYANFSSFTSAVPPRGFSAKHETAGLRADLERSGIPATRAPLLARSSLVTQFCVSTRRYAGLQKAGHPVRSAAAGGTGGGSAPVVNSHNDGNWAGYSVDGGTGFNGVAANWTVQQSNATSEQPNEDSTWIGVGGDANDCVDSCSLIQEGTDMETGAGYRMWFEWVCNTCGKTIYAQHGSGYGISFIPAGSDAVGVGDPMAADVYWNGTSTACFVMVDDNPKRSVGINGCVSKPVPYDSKSIEWVDEDGLSQDNYFMADFGKTYWTEQGSWDVNDNSESLPKFAASPNFLVVGNIAADTTDNSYVPPCTDADVDAYPYGISTASGGSSITKWCNPGPPVAPS
jgi:hypothetical protein